MTVRNRWLTLSATGVVVVLVVLLAFSLVNKEKNGPEPLVPGGEQSEADGTIEQPPNLRVAPVDGSEVAVLDRIMDESIPPPSGTAYFERWLATPPRRLDDAAILPGLPFTRGYGGLILAVSPSGEYLCVRGGMVENFHFYVYAIAEGEWLPPAAIHAKSTVSSMRWWDEHTIAYTSNEITREGNLCATVDVRTGEIGHVALPEPLAGFAEDAHQFDPVRDVVPMLGGKFLLVRAKLPFGETSTQTKVLVVDVENERVIDLGKDVYGHAEGVRERFILEGTSSDGRSIIVRKRLDDPHFSLSICTISDQGSFTVKEVRFRDFETAGMKLDGETTGYHHFSPDSTSIVYTRVTAEAGVELAEIFAYDLASGESQQLTEGGALGGQMAPNGDLYFTAISKEKGETVLARLRF